ncbi:YrhA family protein [uncultured Roseobacter sp.]|uniref:YrhA family protein n=1 Tax=uncultured Roseobacter sp. TaxID=114847 RepID=UPI002614BDF3|nr:YrhA family protein [uncultured Roseobacter sp.]
MKDLLARVGAEQDKAYEPLQGAAAPDQIEALRLEAETRLSARLPDDFLTYLSLSNGTDFNGLILYGANKSPDAPGPAGFWQGLVAANLAWREGGDHKDYVILGETGMDLLTVDLLGENAVGRDRVSGEVTERFLSAGAMIETYLTSHLG